MATAASWLAPRAERTLERPLIPSASNRTATSSMAYLRMSDVGHQRFSLRAGLRPNMASIRSVTRKPPITLNRANPSDTAPSSEQRGIVAGLDDQR